MSNQELHDEMLEASRKALLKAARTAIERGRETDTPVYIWEDGKAVDLLADTTDLNPYLKGSQLLARVREDLEEN